MVLFHTMWSAIRAEAALRSFCDFRPGMPAHILRNGAGVASVVTRLNPLLTRRCCSNAEPLRQGLGRSRHPHCNPAADQYGQCARRCCLRRWWAALRAIHSRERRSWRQRLQAPDTGTRTRTRTGALPGGGPPVCNSTTAGAESASTR